MGFYDVRIKQICERCPRLLILAINGIFRKLHSLDAKVIYLNREQNVEGNDTSFMDMLIAIEDCKYHIEFQLLEGNMAIRMYEYAVKETIQELSNDSNQVDIEDRYEISIVMPEQTVIFLAGKNKKDTIKVNLTLPNKQKVSYQLPCISASKSIEELVGKQLYFLIPFQQVQLNDRLNTIGDKSEETKKNLAKELYSYHKQVLKQLELLCKDGILSVEEKDFLITIFADIEKYLSDKDETVEKEMTAMGDNDYVCWSDRILAEGEARGISKGKLETTISLISRKVQKEKSIEVIADELEEEVDTIRPIYEAVLKHISEENAEEIILQELTCK